MTGLMGDVCEVHKLGLVPYLEASRLQQRLAGDIASGHRAPTLLLLEHPHTYSFGSQSQAENLLWSMQELEARGIELHWSSRGGDVTYHGPGQLVGYPLLPLEKIDASDPAAQVDYIGYLRKLEEVVIQAMERIGLETGRAAGLTGVWVRPSVAAAFPKCPPEARKRSSKIASIGVKIDSRGVTQHGFAINVDPDMTLWQGIIPCGLADRPSIALADLLDPPPTMGAVQSAVIEAFAAAFACSMVQVEEALWP